MIFQWYLLLLLPLLLITSLLHVVTTTVYYVTPDDKFTLNNHTNTLQHYVNNGQRYFITFTNVELHFLTGTHFLNENFIINKPLSLTLNGNNSVIDCGNRQVGISIINTMNFAMKNIAIVQCSMKLTDIQKHIDTTMQDWSAALFIKYCHSVTITDVSITINASNNGLVAVNNKIKSVINNLSIRVRCSFNNISLPNINGIVFYNNESKKISNVSYHVSNYTYNPDTMCSKFSHQCAVKVLLNQSNYNTYVKISNTTFSNLHNVTVLSYYGKSYNRRSKNIWNVVYFYKCKISNNIGNSLLKMLSCIIHDDEYSFGNEYEKNIYQRHYNIIKFRYCNFSNNSNFKSLLHILTINTLPSGTIFKISYCNICFNRMITAIEITSRVKVLWQISSFVSIKSTNISFNTHINGRYYGPSLLSATNAIISLSYSSNITNNSYYYSIFMLHLSLLKLYGHIEVHGNQVRHVFKGKEGSYYLVNESTKIIITHNTVFNVLSQSEVYNEHYQQICYFQFFSIKGNLDELIIKKEELNYQIIMLDNIYTAPIHILNYNSIFPINCSWLIGTAFNTSNSNDVYNRTVNRTLKGIDRRNIGIIPSSICQCVNSTEYNCTSHELGAIYPGQKIRTKLIIPRLASIPQSSITVTVAYKNLPSKGCRVTGVNEISQTHFNSTCNDYYYTIWSNYSSCELYLDSTDSLEMFYVDLQPCPLGFSLQEDEKGCVCDPVLNSDIISVTSCNLDDATILRPANSWISATKYNDTQYYKVSSHCPFDYCIPHASYINLSSPDVQCQFNRSGTLCGHCKVDFSTVFGTSQCKQCSNIYLLIVIPIIIAGFVLVIALFIFNITINNGTVNTFIFYVNIISINYSMFFPKCNSMVCVLISLANLDLGIETCFYDGMDDYAKMWLQLAFPIYLFLIAHLLITGSRYSSRIQKLTAHRALPVLATLLLLSYTKILLTVCRVLFFYSTIVSLPGNHVQYTWSVDTSVKLFRVKFSILFATCLILFIILLPFNILLLFIRKLSRLKVINKFKPLLDVYCGPYKDKYYYWTGALLLVRTIVFGLSVFDRWINLSGATILLGILLCIQGIVHPFKCKFANIQESVIFLDLLCIYVVANYNSSNADVELHVVQFLIFAVFIYFAIFLMCHCLLSTCGKLIRKKMHWITMLWKNNATKRRNHPDVLEIDKINYSEFQESLIALDTYN